MEIGESAQVIEVGRTGLEPGTYGLKADLTLTCVCRSTCINA
ncbi:hypothetical protein EDD27_8260 [Nonomuraea polychroma]|uniref:Uncharacterized protein n=1 Tax=Nonomuraea polychroma TaxID=46176 RepID=A0A438MHW3_9ACTN|nr:hypothetical protein EDD27_8260 [Nonomuraea polychroma]